MQDLILTPAYFLWLYISPRTDDLPLNLRLVYPTCLLSIFVWMFNRYQKLNIIQNKIPDISPKMLLLFIFLISINDHFIHSVVQAKNIGVILSCRLLFLPLYIQLISKSFWLYLQNTFTIHLLSIIPTANNLDQSTIITYWITAS